MEHSLRARTVVDTENALKTRKASDPCRSQFRAERETGKQEGVLTVGETPGVTRLNRHTSHILRDEQDRAGEAAIHRAKGQLQ